MSPCSWFELKPGSGYYAGCFRLVGSDNEALFSRTTGQEPAFGNYNQEGRDQWFEFHIEHMNVKDVKFETSSGEVFSSAPIMLAEESFTNKTSSDQEFTFSVHRTLTNSSTFGISTGFKITFGTEFKCE